MQAIDSARGWVGPIAGGTRRRKMSHLIERSRSRPRVALRNRPSRRPGRRVYPEIRPGERRYRLELAVAGYRRVINSISAAQHEAITVRQYSVSQAQDRKSVEQG